MSHLTKILLILFILCIVQNPCKATIQGSLEYQLPIDYQKLNEKDLHTKAEHYYKHAQKPNCGIIDENTSLALLMYSTLSEMNHQNIIYSVMLGSLYDLCEKDRHARSCLDRALSIAPKRPEPYFYYGEFYYKRGFYKKALDMYKIAYGYGYSTHYETLYRIGDVAEKLGDTKTSLEFLRRAHLLKPCDELNNKILCVEKSDSANIEYYVER